MARLTRTQKYAELRNQLENGRETELKTEELSPFKERLEEISPKEEVAEVEKETTEVKEEISEIKEVKRELDDSLDAILRRMNQEVEKHIDDRTVEKKEEESSIADILHVDEIIDNTKQEVKEPESDTSASIKEEKDEEVKEEVTTEKESEEAPQIQEEIEVVEDVAAKEPEVEKKDFISIEDLMQGNNSNDYLKNTLDEVKAYNRSLGSVTVDDVPKTILDEIRGIKQEPAEDDLSNTVTLEIKKILSELDEPEEPKVVEPSVAEISEKKEEKVEVTEKVETQPLVAETLKRIELEAVSTPDIEEVKKAMEGLPKDVSDLLRQYLEATQEDVFAEPKKEEVKEERPVEVLDADKVEVKSTPDVAETIVVKPAGEASELEAALMNETMPLQVEKTTANPKIQEEEEYEEESGSSRVLNIILIILIVILVLVLIVVAYLILVAQGIIPSLF